MDTADLQNFIAVAHAGGFAAVARRTNIDPSAVSRSIAGLEAELGFRLFQRTTRRLSLTEAGAAYLARVEPLLAELDDAGDMARDTGIGGRMRLAASVAYGQVRLLPLLPEIRVLFPQLRIELLLGDGNLDLVAEQVDIAIRLGPTIPAGAVGVRLHPMRYGIYAGRAYLHGAPRLEQPDDLRQHRCLQFAGPLQQGEWRFVRADGTACTVHTDGDIAIASPLGLRAAVESGLGPALLPDWLVAEPLAAGSIVHCLPDWRGTTTRFGGDAWLLYPSRSWLPAKVRAMIDYLRDRLGDTNGI